MTLLLQAANIVHAHGGNQVLAGASFDLKLGDRLAVVGANGVGKSTLFKIMARLIVPDGGTVTARRGPRVGYLSQESDLDTTLSPRLAVAETAGEPAALEARLAGLEARLAEPLDDEELAATLDAHAAILARLERGTDAAGAEPVLAGLGLPASRWDLPLSHLSGGERQLVALARLLLDEPDVLLLDEPDNHLDEQAKGWLEEAIRRQPGAVGLISHDRWFIDRTANAIYELAAGQLTVYPGNYTAYLTARRERRERQAQLRELQEREYKKLKTSAEQLTQWARQNPKFAARAENQRRKLAEERERLDLAPPLARDIRPMDVGFAVERGSTLVLEARGLGKSYGAEPVIRPFDLVIRQGERVGLVGPNGTGKTTLLRLILGKESASTGTLRLGPSVVVGYYAQEHETLDPAQTPLDLVRALRPMTEQQALSRLVGLQFDRTDAMARIGQLSGGERARLQIAAVVLQGANFLLLDEPTNNLDLPAIEALEAALLGFGGTLLAISHDRYFLDKICGRIIALAGGVVYDYPGGYRAYRAHPALGTPLTVAQPPRERPATDRRGMPPPRGHGGAPRRGRANRDDRGMSVR